MSAGRRPPNARRPVYRRLCFCCLYSQWFVPCLMSSRREKECSSTLNLFFVVWLSLSIDSLPHYHLSLLPLVLSALRISQLCTPLQLCEAGSRGEAVIWGRSARVGSLNVQRSVAGNLTHSRQLEMDLWDFGSLERMHRMHG
ncbi:hypothetical protein FQA47_002194 [Oryzias melastigma]|uniref:Uncharacterized protein n=1 Tax=Oryzias melastigma TaxID=30732 RepID=A0A834F1G1_ORYME|nr:hypothetical protein FQA47_002194 [Oryzias melastigma]